MHDILLSLASYTMTILKKMYLTVFIETALYVIHIEGLIEVC